MRLLILVVDMVVIVMLLLLLLLRVWRRQRWRCDGSAGAERAKAAIVANLAAPLRLFPRALRTLATVLQRWCSVLVRIKRKTRIE